MKLDQQLTQYTKINSRWIKDLNISHDTIQVLEENIGKKISDTPHSMFPSKGHKGKDKQMGLHKKNSFCTVKENISKMKREPTVWENVFANDISTQRFDLQNI